MTATLNPTRRLRGNFLGRSLSAGPGIFESLFMTQELLKTTQVVIGLGSAG
jgi:hypothetical protein